MWLTQLETILNDEDQHVPYAAGVMKVNRSSQSRINLMVVHSKYCLEDRSKEMLSQFLAFLEKQVDMHQAV